MEFYDWWVAETLTERDEWRCVLTIDGGQFVLAVKNWQEPFVHKWDSSLKVTRWIDKFMYCECTIGGTVASPNSFPPGAFPEYRLICTQLSNRTWHCSPVDQQCDSFVEFEVVCKNYEDLYNECSTNCTLPRLSVTTSQSPTTQQG